MKKTIILLTLIVCSTTALWARSIIRVFPQDKASLAAIRDMPDLDDMGQGSGYIDFLATSVQEARLRSLNCRIEVLVPDAEAARRKMIRQKGGLHSFSEMQAELEMIAAGYPAIAQLDTLGYSWEGRPILCLKISDNVNLDEDEPELMYMGNHHAREWITVEVPLRLALMLTDSYGVNPALTDLVNNREFFIIPSVNPDGFVYDYNTVTTGEKTAATMAMARTALISTAITTAPRTATPMAIGAETGPAIRRPMRPTADRRPSPSRRPRRSATFS
jgi:hypothetical protein